MADTTDENLRRVSRLLDILEGEDDLYGDAVGHTETRESGAVGTHEPCLGHSENVFRWGSCPACEGLLLVRSRTGEYDPYLPRSVTAAETPPTPDAPRHAAPAEEPIRLTKVESLVFKRYRLRHATETISKLLRRAPVGVVIGAREREPGALSWLARRMPYLPSV